MADDGLHFDPHELLELARLIAGDHRDTAVAEAQVAPATFERLGATADRDEAAGLLRTLGVRPLTGSTRQSTPALTDRERQVLNLVRRPRVPTGGL